MLSNANVQLSVSPYDVPEAVRGFFDKQNNKFIIEFKYIGSEPTAIRTSEPHIGLRIGENSGRLYGLELDLKALEPKSAPLQFGVGKVKQAIDALINDPKQQSRHNNYVLVQQALQFAQDKLVKTAIAGV